MISSLANPIAIILYAIGSFYLLSHVWRQKTLKKETILSIAGLALIFHGIGAYNVCRHPDGFQLGFFAVSSVIFWVINAVVFLSSFKKSLLNLFIILFPLSIIVVGSSYFGKDIYSDNVLNPQLTLHILLSILAYSLLTIATFQGLLLAYQNHRLRQRKATGLVRLMPPLQTMESLLFEFLWAGEILLTLSILTGFFFLDNIFAQHLVHKTVFSISSWVIYAVLLWGRHALGWRGYTAIRWTLVGFALLMLAYFGSKMVLELILQRTI